MFLLLGIIYGAIGYRIGFWVNSWQGGQNLWRGWVSGIFFPITIIVLVWFRFILAGVPEEWN